MMAVIRKFKLHTMLFAVISMWILGYLLFMYHCNTTVNPHDTSSNDNPNHDLISNNLVKNELLDLTRQNTHLRKTIDSLNHNIQEMNETIESYKIKHRGGMDLIAHRGNLSNYKVDQNFESLTRRYKGGIHQLWQYLKSELPLFKSKFEGDNKDIKDTIKAIEDRYMAIIAAQKLANKADGLDELRRNESESLKLLIRKRLLHIQNPPECTTARKLICSLRHKYCGFGCQIHHITYCFIMAYASKRTLILDDSLWSYSNKTHGAWERMFLPLSTCNMTNSAIPPVNVSLSPRDVPKSKCDRYGLDDFLVNCRNEQTVYCPVIEKMKSWKPKQLPYAVPEDIAERLGHLHGNPIVWWIGQFVTYIMRPSPRLNYYIEESYYRLGFDLKAPVIGMHIRRGDKIQSEAKLHELEEYMQHADEFYKLYETMENRPIPRHIYLATDGVNVYKDAVSKYSQYTFMADENQDDCRKCFKQDNEVGLQAIAIDVFLLSKTNFLICTFSSQVCRLAYELMQGLHPDAHDYYVSLDDAYYFGGALPGEDAIAIYEHHPPQSQWKEINLNPGDKVTIIGHQWNGYSYGTNQDTRERGLFPTYKVDVRITVAKFPTYPFIQT
ncbi:unnamed protein product [Owenia fusiformis]|uniref:Uncharacterized protein n=1 Tax=Owenia fusiformis TaxID=6347 RepID=A0A8J1TIG3_OWEFU|nr:unnamed protein product [Owenia fusiformis]